MDCKSCKESREVISRYLHESDMDRMERINKRLFWGLMVAIFLFVVSWIGFIWYESQWEVVSESTTYEVQQEAEGNGSNRFVGGDYYGEADSQDYEDETFPEA